MPRKKQIPLFEIRCEQTRLVPHHGTKVKACGPSVCVNVRSKSGPDRTPSAPFLNKGVSVSQCKSPREPEISSAHKYGIRYPLMHS